MPIGILLVAVESESVLFSDFVVGIAKVEMFDMAVRAMARLALGLYHILI